MADRKSLKWDALRARLGYGARPNKYLVEIVPPAGVSRIPLAGITRPNFSDSNKIIAFCKGSQIPSREVGVVDINIQGRKIPIPGDAKYNGSWSLTFYSDEYHDLRKQFEVWIENLDSFNYHQRGFAADGWFADKFKVSQLDPKDQTVPTATWEFFSVFPTNISAIDLSADNNDKIAEFTVDFTYAFYNRIK